MSAVETSSTNDVTTSANTSFRSSVSTSKALRQSTVLTTDGIIRECIKQGFYRNPICNEKLYLHNKGYDQIAPTAFEPYTDVKVLWLEGNALSTIACGAPYVQVRPPKRYDPFAESSEEEKEEREGENVNNEHKTKDKREGEDAKEKEEDKKAQHVDPNNNNSNNTTTITASHVLPEPSEVPEKERDVFSSLYGTVRQLYLHNNLFRTMPDLSRFERLDAVNLSNNFFSRVEPHCAAWEAACAAYAVEQAREAELALQHSKSALRERQAGSPARAASPNNATATATPMKSNTGDTNTSAAAAAAAGAQDEVRVVSVAEAQALRAAQRAKYLRQVEAYSHFCPHCPLQMDEKPLPYKHNHASSHSIPHDQRNPCSSLRTLNLASNRLASFEDVVGLLCYKALAVLDLSHNAIEEGEMMLLILERLPQLRSLKLSGNPLVRSLPRYRKTILARCKGLIYLDDRPVFVEERRLVNAWAVGGEDGEAKERTRMKEEKEAAERRRLDEFRALLQRHAHPTTRGNNTNSSSSSSSGGGAHSRERNVGVVHDEVLGNEGRTGGPHEEYISAIAGEAIVRRRTRPTHTTPSRRRDAAELDSSPTSTDEDDSEESEHDAEQPGREANKDNATAAAAGGQEATRVRQPVHRVLSSNGARPATTTEVQEQHQDEARGGEDAQDGQEMHDVHEEANTTMDAMDDVYIPQA